MCKASGFASVRKQYQQTEGELGEYLYPHDFPGGWVRQQYLPEGMQPPKWYQLSDHGQEATIGEDWRLRRSES